MKLFARSALSLGALVFLLSACAGQGADPTASAEPTRPVRSAPSLPSVPSADAPVTGEVPGEIMANLLADAAERTGVDVDDIEVVQAEAVTWSDGSLGCPEPGMVYTQALVDGYHVIVEAGGEELDFRVTANGGFVLCEQDRPGG
jgi:hypothetical protein